MPPTVNCVLPARAKLETPEGPLAVASLARKVAPVLGRRPDAGDPHRFAMISGLTPLGSRPCVRIALENGRTLLAGAAQSMVLAGGELAPAGELAPGTGLAALFDYPPGYRYVADDGQERVASGSLAVVSVEPAGELECYTFLVRGGRPFAFSAGVLGAAPGW